MPYAEARMAYQAQRDRNGDGHQPNRPEQARLSRLSLMSRLRAADNLQLLALRGNEQDVNEYDDY